MKSNNEIVPSCITYLKTSRIFLIEAVGIVNKQSFKEKIQKCNIQKKIVVTAIEITSNILECTETSWTNISIELTSDDICYFKYAFFTFVDVERVFPRTKIFFWTKENL